MEQIPKLALSHILAGQAASTYPLPGESCWSPCPTASRRDFQRARRAGCTANAREPGREDCGAPEGAKFRGSPRGRGGLGSLAAPGSFSSLRSSFLARSRSLARLPLSHPSLFPPLRLRVGSDVTSAKIPPNSAHSGGRRGGRPGASSAPGRARGAGEQAGARRASRGWEAGAGGPAEASGAGERAPESAGGRGSRAGA